MEIKLDWSLHVRWQFRCLIPCIPGLLCSSQRAFPPSSCELRWGQATFSRKVVIKVVLRRLQKPQLGPNDALPLWASKTFTSLRLMTGSKRTASKKPLPFAVTTNYSFFLSHLKLRTLLGIVSFSCCFTLQHEKYGRRGNCYCYPGRMGGSDTVPSRGKLETSADFNRRCQWKAERMNIFIPAGSDPQVGREQWKAGFRQKVLLTLHGTWLAVPGGVWLDRVMRFILVTKSKAVKKKA